MILTKSTEKRLSSQHVGTGYLILKTAQNTLLQVEVYIRAKDGMLCRITDGQPALPIELAWEDEFD